MPTNRNHSWTLLNRLSNLHDLSWLVGGDFNVILLDKRSLGGSDKTEKEIREFNEALNSCSLSDLGRDGPIFTWSNRRFKEGLIKERLDRFVSSYEWNLRFLASKVHI